MVVEERRGQRRRGVPSVVSDDVAWVVGDRTNERATYRRLRRLCGAAQGLDCPTIIAMLMRQNTIEFSVEQDVATIRVCRPESANTVNVGDSLAVN